MPNFYGTFMQKQPFKNHYQPIVAEDMNLARSAMFEQYGDKFVSVYDEQSFEGQPEEFGLRALPTVYVIDHAGRPQDSGLHNEYRTA